MQAYWDARVEGSAEKAYKLLEPEARQRIGLGTYAHRAGQSEILNYEIENIDMDMETKSAGVRVKRNFKIKPGVVPIKIDNVLEQTGQEQMGLGGWTMVYVLWVCPNLDFLQKPVKKSD